MKKFMMSIIVCTYNGEKLIRNCLNSIIKQNFKEFEILCVDGMSTDNTREIINEFRRKDKRIKLVCNKKRFPEGKGFGKWLGFKKSKGQVIGIIDQDNVLQREDLFSSVKDIFQKNKHVLGVRGGIKHDFHDKRVVRYISLIGTDSFFAYRSLDFLSNIDPNLSKSKIEIQLDNLLLTGGNCFFYRKSSLLRVGGYNKDIVTIKKLVKENYNVLHTIPDATKHYAAKNFYQLIKKKIKWGSNYKNSSSKFNYFPKTKREYRSFLQNLFFCFLILPNFIYAIKLYLSLKDKVVFAFPIIAFLNMIVYGFTYLFHK